MIYLILLFTVLPATELAILIELGRHIGVGSTLLLIVFTGVLGAYLARLEGFRVLQNIQHNLNQGNMPTDQMLDGLMILVGGVVLLTPGLITDTIGFLLLIPVTRALVKKLLARKMADMMASGRTMDIHMFDSRRNRDHFS